MSDNLPKPHAGRGHPKIDLGALIKQRFTDGLSVNEIAQIHGVHASAVSHRLSWLQEQLLEPDQLSAFREAEETLITSAKAKVLAQVARDDKIEKLSAAQATWIYGVLYDKHRLHTGKSTQNISHQLTAIIQQAQDDD